MLVSLIAANAVGQNRGLQLLAQENLGRQVQIGKQWAVFIAIDRYKEWAPLTNPVRDAHEIRDILIENYFLDELRELYNTDATAANIRRLFADLRREVQMNDSVFMFYAGHGHTDDLTKTGSWIPTDGGRDELAQANWLPNIQIRNMLSGLAAKHVFLIADSCFSGDILDVSRGASPEINSDYYRRVYEKVSRQVMTSGASETVPDASEFAMRLKSSLRRAENAYVDPEYLFMNVREVRTTRPLLGIIRGTEHQEGGGFLFFRRPEAIAASPISTGTGVSTLPSVDETRVSPGAPRQRPEKLLFSLDGKKVRTLGIAPGANASTFSSGGGFGGGINVSYSFYESYGSYGDFFYVPNTFFASAELFKDSRTIDSSLNQSAAASEGRYDMGGVIAGIGALWKIRLDQNQRFIAGFGVSAEFFIINTALYVDEKGSDKKIYDDGPGFSPGFGLHGGIGFRFNQLVSLELGLSFKMAFAGADLAVTGYDEYGYFYSGNFASGVRPMTIGGSLGARFWFHQ